MDRIFCPSCGANIPKANFCSECGFKIPPLDPIPPRPQVQVPSPRGPMPSRPPMGMGMGMGKGGSAPGNVRPFGVSPVNPVFPKPKAAPSFEPFRPEPPPIHVRPPPVSARGPIARGVPPFMAHVQRPPVSHGPPLSHGPPPYSPPVQHGLPRNFPPPPPGPPPSLPRKSFVPQEPPPYSPPEPPRPSAASASSSGRGKDSALLEQIKRERELLRKELAALSDCTEPRRREEVAIQNMTQEVERLKQRKERILREREAAGKGGEPRQRSPSPPRSPLRKQPRTRSPPPPQPRPPSPPRSAPTVFPRPGAPPPRPSRPFARPGSNWDRNWDEWYGNNGWDGSDWDYKEEQNVSLTISGFEVGTEEEELKKQVQEVLKPHLTEGVVPLFKSCQPDAGKVLFKVGVTDARQILAELKTHKVVLLPSNVPSVLSSLQDMVSVRIWRLPKTATASALRGMMEEFGNITEVWLQDVHDADDWPYLCGRVSFDSPSSCRRAALEYHLAKHFPGAPCSMVVALPKEVFGIGSSVIVTFPKGLKHDQLRDAMSSAGKIVGLSIMPDDKNPEKEKAVVVYKSPEYAQEAATKKMPDILAVTKPEVDKDLL